MDLTNGLSEKCLSDPFKGYDGRYHYVYIIAHKSDGSYYVGKHSSNYPNDSYLGSGGYIKEAIESKGSYNFDKIIISYHNSSEEAYDAEKSLISLEMIESDQCYNFNGGGRGFASGQLNPIHLKPNPFKSLPYERNGGVVKVRNGTHQWLGQRGWKNPKSTNLSHQTWMNADSLYEIYVSTKYGYSRLLKIHWDKYKIKLSRKVVESMVTKFRSNWIPSHDEEWMKFKMENSK
ncbi:Seg-like homing endonuclease protein [Rhizobium phage RHph_TM40]|uniref:Seg-like homing endonuclease protein n=1 Tax=Rhizobium phage RHph_TM30 TaxID=2509764 RepID=A0A7S5R4Q6_9CAUD|nr:homing endonuclease [Rhizobium phage RHph_TM30]QIG71113.1 Seg-like homing endonuclease protein [Rhizobium phage RHph_TM30]QIG71477.1 Seg-like homing endonuclease protein [Rhizobium phage RHph_TM40]QIG71840.1 Seg-like homing endonuclease protein [Rhizobium phage RHph_TM2_3B]QIG72202.1 Seg-like homing endonuclease protein [Rhizobium phage RHph_TM3_3_6]